MSDSNLNRSGDDVRAPAKLVSKESYAKIPERDDLDDFNDDGVDNSDEDTEVSPELRQRKGERRQYANQSVVDGKLGMKTIKIAPQPSSKFRSLNVDMQDSKRRATLPEGRSKRNEDSPPLTDSEARRESLDQSIPLPDHQSKGPPFADGLRGNYGAMNATELRRARLNTDSSSPEQNTFMANQTRDTSQFPTTQQSKDRPKHATPGNDLKSEPRMSKRSSARKDSFRQMQFENEKLKTCIEFLVQGGDWNELVQMFGENDPVLKDIVENYLNKSSQENPFPTAHESFVDLDGPPIQYSEQ